MTELEELKAAVTRFVRANNALLSASEEIMDLPKYSDCAMEYEQSYNALCELAEKD